MFSYIIDKWLFFHVHLYIAQDIHYQYNTFKYKFIDFETLFSINFYSIYNTLTAIDIIDLINIQQVML